MNVFYQGQTAAFSVAFADDAGGVLDPPDVRLRVRPPERPNADYTLAAATVTRVSAGLYRAYVLLDRAGLWRYRWLGTSSPVAVTGGTITVIEDVLV